MPRPSEKSTEKPALQPGQNPSLALFSPEAPNSLAGWVSAEEMLQLEPGVLELESALTAQATLKSISAMGLEVDLYCTWSTLPMRWLGRPLPLHDWGSIFCRRK